MSTIERLLRDVELPTLYPVLRSTPDDALTDPEQAAFAAMERAGLGARVQPGHSVALGVGSRGLAAVDRLVRGVVSWFRQRGAHPFIIPCMGSHGGATAEGQTVVLADLGITPERMGCPVRSGLEVVHLGTTSAGLSVYLDALADAADSVFVINRVKPHPSFAGRHESGLVKMLVIGLGKQRGADACHAFGFENMAANLEAGARLLLEQYPHVLGGLASVENEADACCLVEAVPVDRLLERDAELLLLARQRLPRLPVSDLHALLIDHMGKDVSGSGTDTNVTGRYPTPQKRAEVQINRLAVLRLTPASHGNAAGMGTADIISRRLHEHIDFDATYANVITSTLLKMAKTPVVMPTDEMTVRCLLKTGVPPFCAPRFLRIENTLRLNRLLASPALAAELARRPECHVLPTPCALRFVAGDLSPEDFAIWDDERIWR